MVLTPGDELERDNIVYQANGKKNFPNLFVSGKIFPKQYQCRPKYQRSQRYPEKDNREGGKFFRTQGNEKERASPNNGKPNQHRPFKPCH